MPRTAGIPAYKLHKPSGQARVIIAGKHIYLGAFNSPQSQEKYGRLIAEWRASDKAPPTTTLPDHGLLVLEIIDRYTTWAAGYYVKNGKPTVQQQTIRQTMKLLKELYARTPAADFGPLAMRALQTKLIENGIARPTINTRCATVRHMLKWAASHAMIPVAVFQAAATVPELKRGRTTAREPEPIRPVDVATVDATLEHLPQVVADMVRLQRLIGCRPGEVCNLRPCDVDTSGEVWCYIPESHKTQHHGRERRIFIGPRAQDVLRPYLLREKTAFCFRPVDSEKKRREVQRANRKTKVQPSQVCRKKKAPKRLPADLYTKDSYCRAAKRADAAAKRQAKVDGVQVVDGVRLVGHWKPNQLRHSVATAVRAKYGIEAAQVTLGHSQANVTQIYAERDFALAARIMREVG